LVSFSFPISIEIEKISSEQQKAVIMKKEFNLKSLEKIESCYANGELDS